MDVASGIVRNSSDKVDRDHNRFRRDESNDYHVNKSWRGSNFHYRNDDYSRENDSNKSWRQRYPDRNYNKWRNRFDYNYYHNNYSNQPITPIEELQNNFVNNILNLFRGSNKENFNDSEHTISENNSDTVEDWDAELDSNKTEKNDSTNAEQSSESADQKNSTGSHYLETNTTENDSTVPAEVLKSSIQSVEFHENALPNQEEICEFEDFCDPLKSFLEIVKAETGVDWSNREEEFFQSDDPALNFLYSNFSEELDNITISSTTNEPNDSFITEENHQRTVETSEDCNVPTTEVVPPKPTPLISLVPLSFLIDPNLQSAGVDNNTEVTVDQTSDISKEADPTPSTSSAAASDDAHFKKPEIISRKLINKVATMDKANIRNVINNPIMKFDVALKMNAKKRLREEIRKQLRNMNFETRKQISGENLVKPDGYIDPENIPPEMLEQFESVFNIQINNLSTNKQTIQEVANQADAINSGDESFSESCVECINTKLHEEELNNQRQFNLRTKLLNLEFIKQQAILRRCRQPVSDSDDDVCIIEPTEQINQIVFDDSSSNDSSATNTTASSTSTVSQCNVESKFLQSFKKDVLPNLPEKVRREYESSSGKDDEIAKIYSMCLDKLRTLKWQNDATKPAIDWSNTDEALTYLVQNIRELLNTERNENFSFNDRESVNDRNQYSHSKRYNRHYNRRNYDDYRDRNKYHYDRNYKASVERKRRSNDFNETSTDESYPKHRDSDTRHMSHDSSDKSSEEIYLGLSEGLRYRKPQYKSSKNTKDPSPNNDPKTLREPNHRKEDDSSTNSVTNDSSHPKRSFEHHAENPSKQQNQGSDKQQKEKDKQQSSNSDSNKNRSRSKSRDRISTSNKNSQNTSSPTSSNTCNRKRKHEDSVATSTTSNKDSTQGTDSYTSYHKHSDATPNSSSTTKDHKSPEHVNKDKTWRSAGEKKLIETSKGQPPPKTPKILPTTPEPIIASPAEKKCSEANTSPSSPKGTKTLHLVPEPSVSLIKQYLLGNNISQISSPESTTTPDSTVKSNSSKKIETSTRQKINESDEEMNSQITSSVESQDKTNNTTLNTLKELDSKLMDLNQKKMELEKRIMELQKEKMEIDLTTMQLQNDRFALLSSVVSDSNGFLSTNPNLQGVLSTGNSKPSVNKKPPTKPKKPPKSKKPPSQQNKLKSQQNKQNKPQPKRKYDKKSSTSTNKANSTNALSPTNKSASYNVNSNVSESSSVKFPKSRINPKNENLKPNAPKRSFPSASAIKQRSASFSSPTSTENMLPVSCAGQTVNIIESSDSEDEETDSSPLNSSLSSRAVSNGHLKGFRLPIVKIIGTEGYIICASEDGNIYKFDSNTKQLISTFSKHTESITEMCIDGHGCIYSTSLDGFMKKTSIDNFGLELQSVNAHEPLQAVNICWNIAFIGSRWGNMFTYDIKKNKLNESHLCSVGSCIIAIKATKEGPRRIIIISSKGEKMHFRDASSGLLLRTIYVANNQNIYNIILSGGLLYCGSASNKVFIYDFVTGNEIKAITSGNGAVAIKLYKNKYLFVGCCDGFIYVFNKESDEQIGRFPGAGKMILALEIIGEKVLTSSKDNLVQIVDIPKYILTITK